MEYKIVNIHELTKSSPNKTHTRMSSSVEPVIIKNEDGKEDEIVFVKLRSSE